MSQDIQERIDSLIARETWSYADYRELVDTLAARKNVPDRLGNIYSRLSQEHPDPKGAGALKVGICQYVMCRFGEALATLSQATDNRDRHWFQAKALRAMRNYPQALEEFDRAKAKGWEGAQIELEVAETLALAGRLDESGKALDALGPKADGAHGSYVRALILEFSGQTEEAGKAYAQAYKKDENFAPAAFRLAYFNDLHGDEDTAISLYRRCVSRPPVLASALLNLAVLYEDAGRYDESIACLKRILAINPGHLRARLFLKDAEASKTMYFDEDQAKAIARRNAVLDIPVTDFELSVRARNCLKKMDIRTLGDLVRITEQELLSYKNFGETSLKEIKDMLSAKGLRLGQALEETEGELISLTPSKKPEAPSGNEGVQAIPLAQIELSVRARRALENLKITNLGELSQRSEAELMACKNFGQTSLNEVKQRLAEHGLSLRTSR